MGKNKKRPLKTEQVHGINQQNTTSIDPATSSLPDPAEVTNGPSPALPSAAGQPESERVCLFDLKHLSLEEQQYITSHDLLQHVEVLVRTMVSQRPADPARMLAAVASAVDGTDASPTVAPARDTMVEGIRIVDARTVASTSRRAATVDNFASPAAEIAEILEQMDALMLKVRKAAEHGGDESGARAHSLPQNVVTKGRDLWRTIHRLGQVSPSFILDSQTCLARKPTSAYRTSSGSPEQQGDRWAHRTNRRRRMDSNNNGGSDRCPGVVYGPNRSLKNACRAFKRMEAVLCDFHTRYFGFMSDDVDGCSEHLSEGAPHPQGHTQNADGSDVEIGSACCTNRGSGSYSSAMTALAIGDNDDHSPIPSALCKASGIRRIVDVSLSPMQSRQSRSGSDNAIGKRLGLPVVKRTPSATTTSEDEDSAGNTRRVRNKVLMVSLQLRTALNKLEATTLAADADSVVGSPASDGENVKSFVLSTAADSSRSDGSLRRVHERTTSITSSSELITPRATPRSTAMITPRAGLFEAKPSPTQPNSPAPCFLPCNASSVGRSPVVTPRSIIVTPRNRYREHEELILMHKERPMTAVCDITQLAAPLKVSVQYSAVDSWGFYAVSDIAKDDVILNECPVAAVRSLHPPSRTSATSPTAASDRMRCCYNCVASLLPFADVKDSLPSSLTNLNQSWPVFPSRHITCPGCASVAFCSQSCADSAHDSFHRVQCANFQDTRTGYAALEEWVVGNSYSDSDNHQDAALLAARIFSELFQRFLDTPAVDAPTAAESARQMLATIWAPYEHFAALWQSMPPSEPEAEFYQRGAFDLWQSAVLNPGVQAPVQCRGGALLPGSAIMELRNFFSGSRFLLVMSFATTNATQFCSSPVSVFLNAIALNGYAVDRSALASVEECNKTYGLGLYHLHSIFNHSCAPNATVLAGQNGVPGMNSSIRIIACQDIAAGTQVRYNYMPNDEDATWFQRQRTLQYYWKFTCSCTLCLEQKRVIDKANGFLDDLPGSIAPATGSTLKRCREFYDNAVEARERGRFTAALELFGSAASQGHQPSQHMLGCMFMYGDPGVPIDLDQARSWLEQSSRGVHDASPVSWVNLATLYASSGREVDVSRAFWLRLAAAQQGCLPAQQDLARFFMDNSKPDIALQWFLTAAKHGSAQAMYNAGVCYLKGVGTKLSPDDAKHWLGKAAATGFDGAQLLLNTMAS